MAETKFHTETERKRWIGYYGNRYNKVEYVFEKSSQIKWKLINKQEYYEKKQRRKE